jgi:hypothetical protein
VGHFLTKEGMNEMNLKRKFGKMILAVVATGLFSTSISSVALAVTLQNIRTGTFNNDTARVVLDFDELPSYSVVVENNLLSLDFKGDIDPKSLQNIVLKDYDIQDLGMTKIGDSENVFTVTYDKKVTGYRVFALNNPARIVIDKGENVKDVASKKKVTKAVIDSKKESVKPTVKTAAKEVKNDPTVKTNLVASKKETKTIDTPNGKVTLHRLGDTNVNSTNDESTKVSPSNS